ncbi:MAG: LysR family transcriptional regulator [Deltaproteobacteria bacterium]|nr:LysR family transcriptional regulator [Deltaproteobacteria bacterium]
MELLQLVSFFHTAQTGSVSRAAQAVGRSQPAVSQQLAALEEELGCRLFTRLGKRKLVPTPEGRRLLEFAQRLLADLDTAVTEVRALAGGERGRVTVAAPFTTCYQVLPAVLARFTARWPRVEVAVQDQPQAAALTLVREGEADLALALATAVPPGLTAIPWKRLRPALLVPLGHPLAAGLPITVGDLLAQRLILPPARPRHPGRTWLEQAARQAGLPLTVALETSNVELSARYVAEGLGVSVANLVEDAPWLAGRGLAAAPLDHLLPAGQLAVAFRPEGPAPGAPANFLRTLLEL